MTTTQPPRVSRLANCIDLALRQRGGDLAREAWQQSQTGRRFDPEAFEVAHLTILDACA